MPKSSEACLQCRQAKHKCAVYDNDTACHRCLRKNLRCVFETSPPRPISITTTAAATTSYCYPCTNCTQRGIQCDGNSPCSQCYYSRIQCSSTPAQVPYCPSGYQPTMTYHACQCSNCHYTARCPCANSCPCLYQQTLQT